MAVCNLFKKLDKTTGNFMVFSQYVEDLTKSISQSSQYKVSPSKFICLNINYNDYDNISFPTRLQNYFENGCAFLRSNNIENNNLSWNSGDWNPEISKNLFWNCLNQAGFLSRNDYNNTVNEIKYIGEINLESYDEHDGMGYSEIYCYIPNEGKEMSVEWILNSSNLNVFTTGNDFVEGYSAEDGNENLLRIDGVSTIDYSMDASVSLNFDEPITIESKSFEFNTIIVLYDILSIDNEGNITKRYENIPLGIYLPGLINNGSVDNFVTKFISSNEIYGAGTSYGLRICSRIVVSPTGSIIESVQSDSQDYAMVSYTLSEMSKTIEKMNEVVSGIHQNQQLLKNTLAIFKNSKTNVPYVKEIDGKHYWFVNGKYAYSTGAEAYDNTDIQSFIDSYDNELK